MITTNIDTSFTFEKCNVNDQKNGKMHSDDDEKRHSDVTYIESIDLSEQALRNALSARLEEEAKADKVDFARSIQSLPAEVQFILTMQRWACECSQAQSDLKWVMKNLGTHVAERVPDAFEQILLPIGSYIQSEKLGRYYLNLGLETRTLQGALYICREFSLDMVTKAIQSDGSIDFSNLIRIYATQPTLAIKYYDRNCCDLGITLSGQRVKEKAVSEIKMTRSIYQNAQTVKSLLGWLPAPYKNVIRYVEHWTDEERQCYFLCTEYANAGELLLFIDSYHDIVYMAKKQHIANIQNIQNVSLRHFHQKVYRESLQLSVDGQNAYIELTRYLFQQMVQSIYTIHSQGIAHLDVSCENFVMHYDADGKLLVKLIDFGRATKYPRKERKESEDEKDECIHEYEKFDFSTSTFPGKCRYMSPESSLFLKYQDAEPFDASKEDVYALGVVLFTILTCSLPFDSPFFIVPDEKEPQYGYLNGSKKCKIDLLTMTDVNDPKVRIDADSLDPRARVLQTSGVGASLEAYCLLDYVSHDALDLLQQIFLKRISLKELIAHPFVANPPPADVLLSVIRHVVDFKSVMCRQQQLQVDEAATELRKLHSERFSIQATASLLSSKLQEAQQQQSDTMEQSLFPSEFCASSTDGMCAESASAADLDFSAYDLDYTLPEHASIEASPPPNPDYAVCSSPDAQFSPSPSPKRVTKFNFNDGSSDLQFDIEKVENEH